MISKPSLRVSVLLILSAVASAAFAAPAPPGPPLFQKDGTRCAARRPAGLTALERQIFTSPLQGPTRVGEEVVLGVRSPELRDDVTGEPRLVWSWVIREPEASYIAPHFSHFDLPPRAALVVRSPQGERSWRFQGTGKGTLGRTEGFWGIHIPGSTAHLELWADGPVQEGAVVVDKYARGFPVTTPQDEAVCGAEDSQEAKCLATTEPTVYDKARAVARLMIDGVGACTGWLIGDAGHLMTNQHCIGNATQAANTDYEFMAEGAACATDCTAFGACPGTVAATSATFIQSNAALDYTLVQLPTNASTTFGFLQLREAGAEIDEQIYIPGHPAAWGKQIAFNSTDPTDASGKCEVFSLDAPPCSGGPGDVGYFCDTQGGSSGSPVLAYGDHLVVSLHHCANCPNRGLPIPAIIDDLGTNLPSNAIGGACTATPPGGVAASAAGPSQINVFWSPVGGATLYRVFRATASGGPYTLAGTTTSTSFADTSRLCDTTYYYVVRAVTTCSSVSSDEVEVATTPCAPCKPLGSPLYENGFESGSGLTDWTVAPFGGTSNIADWRGIQTCTAHGGSRIFRFGGIGCTDNYTAASFSFAQPGGSAGVAVPAGTANTRLTFWHRRDFETGFDGGALAVSIDGTNYTFVQPGAVLSGTSFGGTSINDCPVVPSAAGVPVFTGTDANFTQTVVDLDAACQAAGGTSCAGQSVRVGFTAISDCTVLQDGWFLDDVSITACTPDPLPDGETDYYTLAPCRLIDTRNAHGPNGGPALQPFAERAFAVEGACGVPATARALALNITAFLPSAAGNIQVYAGDTGPPATSVINFSAGQVRSNNAIVSLASDGTTTFKARAGTPGALHFIVDVVGYFE